MTINVVGIDIAKNTFQLHGADSAGKPVIIISKTAIASINRPFNWRKPSSACV